MLSSTSELRSDVFVVVRSAHERTEGLCIHLLQEQVVPQNVVVIHERPFSHALTRSLELGIGAGLPWTLCVDADLLVRIGGVNWLVDELKRTSDDVLGGHARILDKLHGYARYAGIHLYRTKWLPQMARHIPDATVSLRPETYAKQMMAEQGHEWIQLSKVIALHDFEQYFRDIYRTILVRVRKSVESVPALLKRAEALSTTEADFMVVSWALRVASSRTETILLDSEQWRDEIELLLTATGLKEKPALNVMNGTHLPDTEIALFERGQLLKSARSRIDRVVHRARAALRGQS